MIEVRYKKTFSDEVVGISLPASKSENNRALVLNHLCGYPFQLHNESDAEDSVYLRQALKLIRYAKDSTSAIEVQAGSGGTTFRFLCALLSISNGEYYLKGSAQLFARPHDALLKALRELGAEIASHPQDNYLHIKGKPLQGGEIEITADISSQYISALMMIGPFLPQGLLIKFSEQPVSYSYIKLTAGVMKRMGFEVELHPDKIKVDAGQKPITEKIYLIEADWSSAAFFYVFSSLSERKVFLQHLSAPSLQGDSALMEIYSQLNVDTIIKQDGLLLKPKEINTKHLNLDLQSCPDLFPALAVNLALLPCQATFTGVQHLVHKESNRIDSVSQCLTDCGWANVLQRNGSHLNLIEANKHQSVQEAPINSFDDHRIAMAFAMAAVKIHCIKIDDERVVNKSFPGFWNELRKLGFVVG